MNSTWQKLTMVGLNDVQLCTWEAVRKLSLLLPLPSSLILLLLPALPFVASHLGCHCCHCCSHCSCHCCGCCHHSPPHLPSLPLPFCHPCRWCGCCLHSPPYLLSVPLPFRHRCCCCSCCRCCCNCLCFSCPFCRCHCCSPSCCRHNCLSGAAKKDCEFLLPVFFTLCSQTFFSINYCSLQNMWSGKSHPTDLFRPSNATIPSHCLILNSLAKRMVSFSWEKNFCTDVNSLFFTLNCCPSSQPAIREISSHRPIFALPPQPLPCLTVS